MAKVFGFPDEVNEVSARVVAAGVVAMAGATIALDEPRLMFPLVYGFAARVAAGPKLSPLGLIATRLVTPRLPVEARIVPGAPKRLAQATGLALSASALLAYYGLGRRTAAYRILTALLVAAGLEAVAGICLACRAFPLLMKAGLVPAETCERCNDIWARHGTEAARTGQPA